MSAREDTIKIHQTLHGYSQGHRLLESSVRLPSKSARLVQINTDMSGPSMVSGFESYLTGYPLPEMNAYALGRTWYAPEMARPGCVWTHSLIIDYADLAQISDLVELLDLFQRPSGDVTWTGYKSPLQLPLRFSNKSNSGLMVSDVNEVARTILETLYEIPHQPLYLQSEAARNYESLVVTIWSQQWPRLRRSFRFCTGSLSNRKTDGEFFDLQVIPRSLKMSVQQEIPAASFIDASQYKSSDSVTDSSTWKLSWLQIAANDLKSKNQFRDFLWRFAADQSEERAAFKPLAEVFVCASSVKAGRASISKLLTLVAEHFPQQSQALRLKQALFGAADEKKGMLYPEVSESAILSELVVTDTYHMFSPPTLSIRNRAQTFYEHEPGDAKELMLRLLGEGITPLGEEFLTGMCETISLGDALALAKHKPDLLPLIIQNNPKLITEPSIWKGPVDLQKEIFDIAVKNTAISEDMLNRLIPVLLDLDSDSLSEEIALHLDSKILIGAVLDWFDTQPRTDFQSIRTWRLQLERQPAHVLDWILRKGSEVELQTSTFALAASVLDPNERSVVASGSTVWLGLARNGASNLGYGPLVTAMSFLLALGFNNPVPSGAELVGKSFNMVHSAALNESLSYANWRILQHHAPSISFWRGWDKCERLRCALIEKFIRFDWPEEYFLEALSDTETFLRTLESCDETSRGRKFLRKVARLVDRNRLLATDEQRRVLRKLTK